MLIHQAARRRARVDNTSSKCLPGKVLRPVMKLRAVRQEGLTLAHAGEPIIIKSRSKCEGGFVLLTKLE